MGLHGAGFFASMFSLPPYGLMAACAAPVLGLDRGGVDLVWLPRYLAVYAAARATSDNRFPMQSIVILISGGGSNMAALVRAAQLEDWAARYDASITAVISNRADAAGLQWAQAQGIATQVISHTDFPDRAQFDDALAQAIAAQRAKNVAPPPLMGASTALAARPDESARDVKPPLVLLAGFMRILTPDFVQAHAGRLINIHPSLLPAFTGLHTHQRAIAAGCKFAGATVHRVTEVLDEGAILEQSVVPVLPEDDAKTLAARVLVTEHLIYPRAVRRLLAAGLS